MPSIYIYYFKVHFSVQTSNYLHRKLWMSSWYQVRKQVSESRGHDAQVWHSNHKASNNVTSVWSHWQLSNSPYHDRSLARRKDCRSSGQLNLNFSLPLSNLTNADWNMGASHKSSRQTAPGGTGSFYSSLNNNYETRAANQHTLTPRTRWHCQQKQLATMKNRRPFSKKKKKKPPRCDIIHTAWKNRRGRVIQW